MSVPSPAVPRAIVLLIGCTAAVLALAGNAVVVASTGQTPPGGSVVFRVQPRAYEHNLHVWEEVRELVWEAWSKGSPIRIVIDASTIEGAQNQFVVTISESGESERMAIMIERHIELLRHRLDGDRLSTESETIQDSATAIGMERTDESNDDACYEFRGADYDYWLIAVDGSRVRWCAGPPPIDF